MNTKTKFSLTAILLVLMPLALWAQPSHLTKVGELNIHNMRSIEERVVILHTIQASDIYSYVYIETEDRFDIFAPANYTCDDTGESPDFDIFLESCYDEWMAYNNLDKSERGALYVQWRFQLADNVFQAINADFLLLMKNRDDNATCDGAFPFCTDNGLYNFPAGTNSGSPCGDSDYSSCSDPYMCTGTPGQSSGCLYTAPNPAFYYMRIDDPGNLNIHMQSNPLVDIDFDCWGPFSNIETACSQLSCSNIVDCGYSTSATEDCHINNAQTGQYYILLITNYSNSACNISFSNTGTGSTDCSILPPLVDNDGPYCVGETIHLTANGQSGASYSWSGPNGFSSNQQNPSRANCTMAMAGTYTCTITVGNQSNSSTTNIVVYAQPTANFNATTVCVGNATQFTSTSTTNPSGQSIGSYQWNFGDGGTGTGSSTTHTYSQPGTYQATLTVSTGNGHCTDQITKTVTVSAQPTASFTATTVCVGNATQFTSNSTGDGITSYQWNFGDNTTGTGQSTTHTYSQPGTYQVTLLVQTSGGCTNQVTRTVTVNAQPTARFNATTVCQGQATQFTSTSTGDGISSYQWNFGDNSTGTGQNATHTYSQPGTYQVTLTVQTGSGCLDQVTQNVVVNALPNARFTASNVCQGTPMQFTSTSTGDQISSYQWTFGDGSNGTGQTVSHNYGAAGTYPVTLTVQTAAGCTDTYTQNVEVYATPVASATATPSTVIYGGSATLNANAGAQGVFSFHWEPANLVVSPNSQTTQTVALQETQTFTVTITNPQGGCSSTAQVIVSIDGSSLLAMATADQTDLCDGESTTLHAIPSGGAPENYTFTWSPAATLSNPNSQNPVATPAVGNTTYSCHVSDGFTDIDVSVTIHVHPNVERDIYHTICDNDTYSYFGEDIHTPGVYDHTLHTQFGCDSIVHLHLDNWLTYETPVNDRFCQGEQYDFLGETLSTPGIYYHTLYSAHGCDSVIRLNLQQNPAYEFDLWESTCQGGDGYFFEDQYWQPSATPYVFEHSTYQNCDSIIYLHVEESEYNSKSYNISLCGTEYTWPSNGVTYYESGVYYDTLHYAATCDSTLILNLEIRPNYSDEVVAFSCDEYRWRDDDFGVDMTFTESAVYTHHYTNAYGCSSEATLYLTISSHDELDFTVPEDEACDEYFWDPNGHEILYTDHDGLVYDMSGTYHRTYSNIAECDSLVTMHIQLEYTPHPTPIYPMDANNTAPHWVVTASEFQINTYDFNLWDINPNCHWDTVTWQSEGAPDWIIEPFGNKGSCCKVYVLNHVDDTIWLTAHAFNRCAPDDGVMERYWLVCSFYGIEELADADFSVVPNPNNGQMKLNFDGLTGKINVKVYDMKGALIDDFTTYNNTTAGSYTYQMKKRAEGIYLFVATGKEGTIAKKVIIQR